MNTKSVDLNLLLAFDALRMSLLWNSRVSEESSHKWRRDFIAMCAKGLA